MNPVEGGALRILAKSESGHGTKPLSRAVSGFVFGEEDKASPEDGAIIKM